MEILKDLDTQAKKILKAYDRKHAAVLPLLHLAQEKIGCITPAAEAWVSAHTQVPPVHVHEVVTFYTLFRQKRAGRHHIRFCTTTSCVLMGCASKLEYLKKKLKIQNGITQDGRVSLEEVECLCACEQAPMMQVDDKYYGPLDEKKIDEILENLG